MQGIKNKVNMALREYASLEEVYLGLICNSEIKLESLSGVVVHGVEDKTLTFEGLGQAFEIRFDMAFLNPQSPIGQATAYLIESGGQSCRAETEFLSLSFDHLGNVKVPSQGGFSMEMTTDNRCLSDFIYKILDKLIDSDTFSPGGK